MTNNGEHQTTINQKLNSGLKVLLPAAMLALGLAANLARADSRYVQVNLVSDIPGLAMVTDTNLVNAWGISRSSGSPFWVSDNGTGKSTLYAITNDAQGVAHVDKQALVVNIPGDGNPTGQLFDGGGHFHGDIFIFASEDGTISGWRPVLGTNAETLATRSGAVYKGITMATMAGSPVLLAANFSEATVDAYDTNLSMVAQFSDPRARTGYAPFNVQSVADIIFVTFAKQDEAKEDDVKGRGHGIIDVFDTSTATFHRFATGTDAGGNLPFLNSPWGVVLAPNTFGEHAGQLLVGNFGSGTIMAFGPRGGFRGLLQGVRDNPIRIDGLWGLTFGNGARGGDTNTLYFSAGPQDESHGLFGSLTPVRNRDREGDQGEDNDSQ